jgi:glycerol-3-phosphate acyltransferase PlsX
MRIGIDAMGGDHAPEVEVKGALAAKELLGKDDRIVLVGQEPAVRQQLAQEKGWEDFIEIRHAEQVIRMDDPPVESLRTKPDSSVAVLAQMHRDREIDACISAGNTGAFVAAAQMRLRRLQGVHRPGIAVVAPTWRGPVAICDVGANVSCRPQHLYQYGLMASAYLSKICGVEKPRVGLLSVGEEDGKGNELVKGTRELMKADPNVNFIGNVEGRDLFKGVCDVMVADGFTGNVILKLMEGMAEGIIRALVTEMAQTMPTQVNEIKLAAKNIARKYDFNEYGGAPLLGVDGICIICHGASDFRGIKNAVRAAMDFSKCHLNDRITQLLSEGERIANG